MGQGTNTPKTMNGPTDLIGLFYEKPNQKTSFLSKMIKCLEIAICFIQVSAMIIVTLLLLMMSRLEFSMYLKFQM